MIISQHKEPYIIHQKKELYHEYSWHHQSPNRCRNSELLQNEETEILMWVMSGILISI